jgi:hypothetical protein
MSVPKQMSLWLNAFMMCAYASMSVARADETPRETIQSAIKAHGGEENIAKTLTGTLLAKATVSLPPAPAGSVSWEETFELPLRYRRSIKGQFAGKDENMEYAITNGNGWIRRNGGEARDFKGDKLPLNGYWNAILAMLPTCLGDQVKLTPGGRAMVDGRETLGVKVSGESFGGEATLYFDAKSRLLVKSKRRMQHPLTRQEVDAEVLFSDYKETSGIQYPRRITTFVDGKQVIEMEITRIELLKKLDDRLFEKP